MIGRWHQLHIVATCIIKKRLYRMKNSEEIHSPREASKGDDLWECKFCSFENTLLLSACEMCENKRPFSPSKI